MAESFQLPPIPPINLEEYKWKQSATDPALWQRRACGAEAVVGLQEANSKGEYDLFYAATVELQSGKYTLGDVKVASQAAWRLLRYEQPQIAGTAGFDGQSKCLLQYRVPKDEQEVKSWIERTILVEASDRSPMQIRDTQEKERQLKDLGASESATIYLSATATDQSTTLGQTELRFLFRVNHLFFDGIGFRVMIAAFFRGLAVQLSKASTDPGADIDWSKTVAKLTPACVELLVPEQKIAGPEFDASMGDLLGSVMKGMVCQSNLSFHVVHANA